MIIDDEILGFLDREHGYINGGVDGDDVASLKGGLVGLERTKDPGH